MDNFSFARVFLLLKKFIYEEKRRLLAIICIGTLLIMIGSSISHLFIHLSNPSGPDSFDNNGFMVFNFIAVLFTGGLQIAYCSAHSLPHLANKVDNIAYTLLPASTNEKFVTAIINSLIVPIIIFIVTYGCSEVLNLLFFQDSLTSSISNAWTFCVKAFNADCREISLFFNSIIFYSLSSLLLNCAWFLCSATIFRKHPFLLGMVVGWVVSQILSLIMLGIFDINMFKFVDVLDDLTSYRTLILTNTICNTVMSVVLWVVTYYRMKRTQI